MKQPHRREGRGAIELIEEAVHLLRSAPVSTLASYYLGSLPFVLGLLFFWADMSISPFANQHLIEASLGLTVLFLWLKFWQTVFVRRLRAQIGGDPPPRWTFRRCRRTAAVQLTLQPWGLLPAGLLAVVAYWFWPLAVLLALPAAWLLSLFQNVTAVADSDSAEARAVFTGALRQWRLSPGQNTAILGIMLGFGFCVFLNLVIAGYSLPYFVKMFFGIESVFTRSGPSMLNSTFFATVFSLTYLCVDPIFRSIYTLRCFYGESLETGEDLKAKLKQCASRSSQLATSALILFLLAGAMNVRAAENPAPARAISSESVSAQELDRAIGEVIQQRKYVWRMPREKVAENNGQPGIIARFFDRMASMIRNWLRAARDWLQELLRRIFYRNRTAAGHRSGWGWIMESEVLLYTLIATVAVALTILIYRTVRGRRQTTALASQAIQPVPDLSDEGVSAEELPEEGWIKVARELLARGELRLAIRAFYLASLAHLAGNNLISLAKFKSNRDYERELRRRAHSFPDLLALFGEIVSVFDRSWYGMHEVNGELVDRFAANVEQIKNAA